MTRLLCLLFHDVYVHTPDESGFRGPTADHYKHTLQQFEQHLQHLARIRPDKPVLLTESVVPARPTPFAVTFDDGGVSFYTAAADRLEALGWRGHCFVTTGHIGHAGFLNGHQIRELRARGHVIGTHSASHPPRFSSCGRQQMLREWTDSRNALADLLGEDVRVASLPGGQFSRMVAMAAAEAGLEALCTSEPRVRLADVGGCLVIGRFTVRPGHGPDFSRRLGEMNKATRLREALVWKAKKIAKASLGRGYMLVSGRLLSWRAPR